MSVPEMGMKPTEEELEELEYWLENEDWYQSRFTVNWLQRTPPDVAVEVLAPLAAKADLEPRNPWAMFVRGFVASGFTATSAVAGKKIRERRGGIRAALMLADLNDARALPALARVFEPNPAWHHKFQELIEQALVRFLSQETNYSRAEPYAENLRDLARRIWEFGGDRRDLSARYTGVLLAILPVLRHLGGPENESLLKEIADSSAEGPNRQRVREAAA